MQQTCRTRAKLRLDCGKKMTCRCQSVLADEGHQLLYRHQKCDCVNETEEAQNDEARQPIRISAREKSLKKVITGHPWAPRADCGLRLRQSVQHRMLTTKDRCASRLRRNVDWSEVNPISDRLLRELCAHRVPRKLSPTMSMPRFAGRVHDRPTRYYREECNVD